MSTISGPEFLKHVVNFEYNHFGGNYKDNRSKQSFVVSTFT